MGFLYALCADAGTPRFCASNIEPGDLFGRNGHPRYESPYTRALAAQLGHGHTAGLPYTLFFASRVDHGNVAIEAVEQALARLAEVQDDTSTETGVCELFKATARHLGLPAPVREFGYDSDDCCDEDEDDYARNPYFDDDNWRQRDADRDDQLRRQAD